MTARKAKQYTTCSFCGRNAADIALFMCIKDDCDSFGEMYCQRCGSIAHETRDHQFNINSGNVKSVSLDIIKSNIKDGVSAVQGTLGVLEEQQYGKLRRQYISAIIGGTAGGAVAVTNSVATAANNVLSAVSHLSMSTKTATSTIMGTVTDCGLVVAPHALGAAGIGAGVMFGFEVFYHSYRFWRGEIATWKEYGYHVAKGLTASVGMGLGNWGGVVAGAAIGAIGGPIGAIIGGVIGGIVGGIIGAKVSRAAFEQIWSDDFIHDEQKQRTELIKKALALFGIVDMNDINDETKFNAARLRKKYKELAKIYHPDKNGGSPESHAQFAEISAALGILLVLLEEKDKPKIVRKMKEVKAITYNNDVRKLRAILKTEKLISIAEIFEKWNKQYTLEHISSMREQDILAVIQDINDDEDLQYNVTNTKKTKFVRVIKSWREWSSVDNDDIIRVANRENVQGQPGQSGDVEEEKNDVVEEGENDVEIEKLRDELKEKNLLDVAEICEQYDDEYCLENLIEYSKDDILEVINEINNDDSNQFRISVAKKNKFARTIYTFK